MRAEGQLAAAGFGELGAGPLHYRADSVRT